MELTPSAALPHAPRRAEQRSAFARCGGVRPQAQTAGARARGSAETPDGAVQGGVVEPRVAPGERGLDLGTRGDGKLWVGPAGEERVGDGPCSAPKDAHKSGGAEPLPPRAAARRGATRLSARRSAQNNPRPRLADWTQSNDALAPTSIPEWTRRWARKHVGTATTATAPKWLRVVAARGAFTTPTLFDEIPTGGLRTSGIGQDNRGGGCCPLRSVHARCMVDPCDFGKVLANDDFVRGLAWGTM